MADARGATEADAFSGLDAATNLEAAGTAVSAAASSAAAAATATTAAVAAAHGAAAAATAAATTHARSQIVRDGRGAVLRRPRAGSG